MLLNLPSFTVINQEQTDDDMCIVVETDYVPTRCPQCSNLFGSFYGHGTRPQFFHDLPMLGKRVALKIHRKRFKCRDCNGTFEEPLAVMHPDHLMTKRLAEYITKQCYRDRFTDVARHTGVTEKTARNKVTLHKVKAIPQKFNKDAFMYSRMTVGMGVPSSPSQLNYGVDISTFITCNFDDLMSEVFPP